MDAVFDFFQVVQTPLKAVERFDNVGKTLVFLLTADARLHPAVEGPDGEDDNPEFHGASGPGSAGHVFDTESLQGFAQSVVNPVSAGWRNNYDARKPLLARARAERPRCRAALRRARNPPPRSFRHTLALRRLATTGNNILAEVSEVPARDRPTS